MALEPDPGSFRTLKAQVKLNGVADHVDLLEAAAGTVDGTVPFEGGQGSESRVGGGGAGSRVVRCVRLDTLFGGRSLSVLKIDVEGYEQGVLAGAIDLLRDPDRAPRAIYVEVHPYAWPGFGTSSETLLGPLAECGHRIMALDGAVLHRIDEYGEIVACRMSWDREQSLDEPPGGWVSSVARSA